MKRNGLEEETHVVVSYVPLLRGEAGTTVELDRAAEVLEPLLDTDAGHVHAIVWAQGGSGAVHPVLVLDRAKEVLEHLLEWSEGDPASWFKLIWDEADDAYALAIVPRVEKSVERYRLARRLLAGRPVGESAKIQVVFVPIRFRGPKSGLSGDMLSRLASPVEVGFLDRADLPSDPARVDPGAISSCGPFEVERDRAQYLRQVM